MNHSRTLRHRQVPGAGTTRDIGALSKVPRGRKIFLADGVINWTQQYPVNLGRAHAFRMGLVGNGNTHHG